MDSSENSEPSRELLMIREIKKMLPSLSGIAEVTALFNEYIRNKLENIKVIDVKNATVKQVTLDEVEPGSLCSICAEDFKLDESTVILPCNHTHHEGCILSWFKSKQICPICGIKITYRFEELDYWHYVVGILGDTVSEVDTSKL